MGHTDTITPPLPLFDKITYCNKNTPPPSHKSSKLSAECAIKDWYVAYDFILSYRGSEGTFNSYRREIERLLQWCWHIGGLPLGELQRENIEKYLEFCQSPPGSWIGIKNVERYLSIDGKRVPNQEWRPFVGKRDNNKNYEISQASLSALFAILGSFFNALVDEGYLGRNPIRQIRQKSRYLMRDQQMRPIRRLSREQWLYLIDTTMIMADSNPQEYERSLFILSACYLMYLRISELVVTERWTPQMNHFYRDSDGRWWFCTVGKGNKKREIAVSQDMLLALRRYRKSQGLAPLPGPHDSSYLLTKLRSGGPLNSTRQIRRIVEKCYLNAYNKMVQDGRNDEALELKHATVHWLRHTGISDDVLLRPREHVRDDAGHSSSVTTDRYIDVERGERHISAQAKMILDDEHGS